MIKYPSTLTKSSYGSEDARSEVDAPKNHELSNSPENLILFVIIAEFGG